MVYCKSYQGDSWCRVDKRKEKSEMVFPFYFFDFKRNLKMECKFYFSFCIPYVIYNMDITIKNIKYILTTYNNSDII